MIYVVFLVIWIALNFFLWWLRAKEKAYLIFNGIYLLLIAGMRSIHVGADVENYGRVFAATGKMSVQDILTSVSTVPKGYRLLDKLVYTLTGGSYQVMIFLSALIIIYGVFKLIHKYSPNAVASIFYFVTLFYYFEGFNIVRQWIAMSIALLGLMAIDEKKYLKFAVLAFFAVNVHNSVVILIGVYLGVKIIRWNKLIYGIYTVAVIAAMSLFPYLITLFMRVFPQYANYTFILRSGYSGEAFGGAANGRRVVLSISFLIVILFALLLLSEKALSPETGFASKPGMKNTFWTCASLVMIEIIIGCVFSRNSFYLRIQTFVSFFSIILLPLVFERITKKWRFLTYVSTNILFLAADIFRIASNNSGVGVYEFFWQ